MGIVKIREMMYLCNPKMNVMARLKYNFTWKKYHRWLGLVLSVFMLVFCVSGIILNHREVFSGCEVSRKWLPASYYIKKFQQWSRERDGGEEICCSFAFFGEL